MKTAIGYRYTKALYHYPGGNVTPVTVKLFSNNPGGGVIFTQITFIMPETKTSRRARQSETSVRPKLRDLIPSPSRQNGLIYSIHMFIDRTQLTLLFLAGFGFAMSF